MALNLPVERPVLGEVPPFDPWTVPVPLPDAEAIAREMPAAVAAVAPRVELIGTTLRARGSVQLGNFHRLSDYVNMLDGTFTIHDVAMLTRTGDPTRIAFPNLRVRLDEIALVGQADAEAEAGDEERVVQKSPRRVVLMTAAHLVGGFVHLHEEASLGSYLESSDPRFIPMTNVRVRWLADRRLAGRFPFALVQRTHVIGFSTEG